MFIEFFQENILYFGILFALITLFLFDIQKNSIGGAKKVAPSSVPLLQRDESLFILDVSPQKSFDDGHISGSINIPANKFNAEDKLFKANTDQKVLIVDQNGMQASSVAKKIKAAGYEDVVILDGGIASWQKENFPLSKK